MEHIGPWEAEDDDHLSTFGRRQRAQPVCLLAVIGNVLKTLKWAVQVYLLA